MKQFETFCKRCGQKILMTWSEKDRRWVPCDPEIRRYRRSGGPFTYVNTEGAICRGERIGRGYPEPKAEFGYQRHRAYCSGIGRDAV